MREYVVVEEVLHNLDIIPEKVEREGKTTDPEGLGCSDQQSS